MSSYVGSRIQINTREGKYEGILHSIDTVTKLISLKQATALPSGQKYLGLLNFYGQEIEELTVVEENKLSPVASSSHEEKNILEARSYEDPDNPEIFDDYQQGNHQGNSYAEDWGYDPGPPYSEEVVIPQGPDDNGPEKHSADTSHQAVCEGVKDLSLNNNIPLHVPRQSSSPTKPNDTTTGSKQKDYILINQNDAVFDQAIADMEQQSAIGLVLKASHLGRKGTLALVLVLCDEQVYMFDVLAFPSLFTRKFIDVLQAKNTVKVVHDCRFVSDLLYNHYGIRLTSDNVFDTQLGDTLIKKRQYMGDFPRNVSGTTQCILEYLDISIQDIAMHLENTQRIEEDESSWLQRPLSNTNIRCALLDTVYLLHLRKAITEQLMAEFTCGIDICLAVERDRLDVDTKKLSSRASYVPRELINGLHRSVVQMGMSNTRVKPKELSYPLSSPSAVSSNPTPPEGPACRGTSMQGRRQEVPWGLKKTPQRVSTKPSMHEPPRPPLMMGGTGTAEEEAIDEVLSVSSEDSDEPFADSTEKELWQQRYSKNIKPVTLKEALTAKEENDDMLPRHHGTTAPINEHQQYGHRQPITSSNAKQTAPLRTIPTHTPAPAPKEISETGETMERPSPDRLRLPKGSSRAGDMVQRATDHSYSQQPGSVMPSRLTDLRQHDASHRQSSAVPKKLTSMPNPEVTQRHPSGEQDILSGQASYADALSGKKKPDEGLKMKANRTLRAIGKALAAGENFDVDDEKEDNDKSESKADTHNAFDGYSSYGQGYSGFNGRNKHTSSEKASGDQSPSRTIGRGRASLISHQSQVLNARQSQLQNRVPGGLIGMRSPGRPRTVQVDFPTTEEMDSAPDSIPIAAGSTFLSQRAI